MLGKGVQPSSLTTRKHGASRLAALVVLLASCHAVPAFAQSLKCVTAKGIATCTLSGSFTAAVAHDTVIKTVPAKPDTVKLPAPPAVHITDTLYAPCMSAKPCPVIVAPPPVVAPPATLAFGLTTLHRSRTIEDSVTGYIPDSLAITFSGSGSAAVHWVVTHNAWWHILTTADGHGSDGTGVGSGVQHWIIQTGQHPGVYVDTFFISAPPASGSPLMFVDSLLVMHHGVIPPPVVAGSSAPISVVPLPVITPDSSALLPHPRVWMTPARLALLKQSASNNTVAWQRVKAYADASLADTTMASLPSVCLAYLATGGQQYAVSAGIKLSAFAVASNTIAGDSYYGYRFDMPLVTAGLDWCYAGLSPAVRKQVAGWLMDRADAVWPETDSLRFGAWGVADYRNNYYWGFMFTGPAALAAFGDDPRAAYHRGLVESHWKLSAMPLFAADALGGAWPEGTGYDSGTSVARIADAFLTSGTPLNTAWLTDAINWQMQETTPDFLAKAPFGDQARISDAPIFTYDRVRVEDMLPFASPVQAAQLYAWMRFAGQQATSEIGSTMSLSDELLRFDPSVTPATDLSALPLTAIAAGPGYVVGRSSHATNATFWTFHSGTLVEDHQSGDNNALMIWQGGWILGSANLWSASGIEQSSADFNTLTVDSTVQSHYAGNAGSIVASQLSDTFAVVRGQAATSYGLVREFNVPYRPVTDYLRTVAYLPSLNAFVVVDRLALADSSKTAVFRWHAAKPLTIAGQTFTASNGTARCVGQLLTPAVLGSQAFKLGDDTTVVSSYAVTVIPKSAVTVTVIQCGTLNPVSLNQTNVSSTLTLGSRTVIVPNDAGLPVTVH